MQQLKLSFNWILFLFATTLMADQFVCCPPPGTRCERHKDDRARLFSSVSCEPCGYYFVFDAAFLAWQAREEGLNFAFRNEPYNLVANTNVSGDFIGIDFKWEPALKLQCGVLFQERAWDLTFRWTYFHTSISRNETTPQFSNGSSFIPIWIFPNANLAPQFTYGSVRGNWELTFHEFDIALGYEPFLSETISLRYLTGLKVLCINQDFGVHYSDGYNDGTVHLIDASADLTNRMTGTGPRFGFDSKWRLPRGFSLNALIAGSLPLWHYRVIREDLTDGIAGNVQRSTDASSRERFWAFHPVLETLLGVSWDTCLGCQNQFPFGIGINYEFQYFSEANMLHKLVNPGLMNLNFFPRGDLHLHGVSFNLYFGF